MAITPKAYKRHICLALLLLAFCSNNRAFAQFGWSAARFAAMDNGQRFRYVHDFPFYKIDSGAVVTAIFEQIRSIAQKQGDIRTELAIDFYNCVSSGNIGVKLPGGISSDSLLRYIRVKAKQNNLPIEEAVADYNVVENAANSGKISVEQRYTRLIEIADEMQALGYQNFKDYYIENIMLRIAMVMWNLEDYEKAYHYLKIAEQYARTGEERDWFYTQVMSYLQTYWKQKKDYTRSLQYAFKIKNYYDSYTPPTEFSEFWRGFSTIEVADLLVKQGKAAEGEPYADKGYLLSKTPAHPQNLGQAYEREYDALIVLIDTKLSVGKVQEAAAYINRAQFIKKYLEENKGFDYFKPIRLYRYLARFNEAKGNATEALNYVHRADMLQDSLNKRNDVHRLAQAQLRHESEKYAKKIASVEQEKSTEKMLRNVSVIVLALVITFGLFYYRRSQARRRQKELELAATKQQLLQQTQILREKSEQADKLHAEIERLSATGQRSDYLEQLTQATILTDDDWATFRVLFEKAYPSFISEQKQQYPGITPAEIRLVVLEKLELTTQEMANMLGVSKNTIHQTRLRMRKKQESVTA
ncbi:tetratricopeptide repeat protein [Mucilaginibacter pedocola]|uniref:hypothetical protein n=1 Tax=Mucilaginibacter pedocola TaxID=1792845 RepID=UPI00117C1018|nr:hypothetical protein [Mucilaginibacter pedocola]